VPAVHDITLRDYRGTHQIDHVAAAGACLYLLETKTWRGQITERPPRQTDLAVDHQRRMARRKPPMNRQLLIFTEN
jgi:hypothetical protein